MQKDVIKFNKIYKIHNCILNMGTVLAFPLNALLMFVILYTANYVSKDQFH